LKRCQVDGAAQLAVVGDVLEVEGLLVDVEDLTRSHAPLAKPGNGLAEEVALADAAHAGDDLDHRLVDEATEFRLVDL
jgi:hypothetical protein